MKALMNDPILLDIPESLETPRLYLKMPTAGWGEALYKAILDGYPDYVQWLDWPISPPSLEAVEKDCRQHHADFVLRTFIRYLIIEKSSGDVVGRCAFPSFGIKWKIPQFSLSYFIRKSKRGLGYAAEASHGLTILAFSVLNARKVEIQCDAENVASYRIPEKLNFTLEYTQKGGWPRPDGQLATLKTYSLFNPTLLPPLGFFCCGSDA